MGKCETCKFWWRYGNSGRCEKVETNDHWTELEPGEKVAIAMEVDAFDAHLQTAPDFGCVLHEERVQ